MSSLTIPSAPAAALPAMNVHPHGHGHKKGSQLDLSGDSADSSSSTAAQVPVASAQNLFSKAFTALEELVGLHPPSVASGPAAASSTNSAAPATQTVNPKINLMA